jgi:peptidoglycan/LPS O-acetylase OafA/YrhL
MASKAGYRRDIDGLRAVAILPVILFHLGFRYTPGGFLGVDIFFVISGYLITSHIIAELHAERFSLATFYERRVRRIAPALFVMMFGASFGAYFLLYPAELLDFGRALAAAVLSISNIYFWQTTNYFTDQSNPLLHTWSLAVEEQFYVFIPLLLLLIFRYRRRWVPTILVIITVGSLLLCLLTYQRYPDATFYLLPQRAFELLIGSLFGIGILRCPANQLAREVSAALGLAMTLVFIVALPTSWHFPGPGVLVPCLGAGLVLAAGSQGSTLAARLLSIKPLRGVGLISYSVYLWHVPLIAASAHMTGIVYGKVASRVFPFLSIAQSITVERILELTTLSLVFGYLSWRFVEQPIRFGRFKPDRQRLFVYSAGIVLVLLVTSGIVIRGHGLPSRFPPEVIAITSLPAPNMKFSDGICIASPPESDSDHCKQLDPHRPNWLLIGDSHAGHLDYGLHTVFPEVNILQFVQLGCKPVPDSHYGELDACATALRKLYKEYLPNHHFDLVILSANWQPFDLPRIASAIDTLAKLRQPVMLVGPIMRYDAPLRLLLANQIMDHDPSLAARHRVLAFDQFDRQMSQMAEQNWHVPYFSFSALCPLGACIVWSSDGIPLQWDETHLLEGGSVIAARAMRDEGVLRTERPYAIARPALVQSKQVGPAQ